ncbi:16S rRNA (cytosine(967)-C(5))-methyltransferase RsmB [Sulfuritalea sp.]|uniref:16S rRNA (cytosine(967)-C(5))-methyltransferase RsmB n=1 Tax=Sulfuritalea sp. TaxID=2480090 RepID=UPI001ACAD711|nr:16S rRNA (cytosine(967)-C(5))-methyltransferase RsmB [Sulfuritalea sp.]MBN8473713.1 16S rRNA (cytosine(967)-C(5))-methyltransferase RsmB [Sulfuritalea sp.]
MQLLPPLAETLHAAAGLVAAVIAGRNFDTGLARAGLVGPVRAATMDLAYTTLRAFGRGDYLLGRLLQRPLKDASARGLLLVALARLEARPDDGHTTVDQAVTAATRIARGRYKGLVNGVLRNFLRRRADLLAQAEADPVARWRHPAWWIARLQQDHPARWESILAAGNSHPPLCLRVNRRRATSADFSNQLAVAGIAARVLDDCAILVEKPVPVERIPGFAAGLCSVQDHGAQAAAALLDARDGMRVLDACAAPGGKAAHLLEIEDVRLTALDADTARVARIAENLARLGLTAEVRVADARSPDTWWDGRAFDRILADVPCSASGVVRRHPDAKWLRREADIASFAATQREIIDALWRTLAPGGKMVYATCSVFHEENARQVESFLARHADARQPPATRDAQLQLLPDAEHDGFYYALLQKA